MEQSPWVSLLIMAAAFCVGYFMSRWTRKYVKRQSRAQRYGSLKRNNKKK